MRIIHSMGHVVGGTFLIAGTTIGVGMLALPIATGAGGFVPSVSIYLACWLFMLCTGLLLVEINLWMPKDTSFISMAEQLLGPVGKAIFWVAYLFLFVTVMIAHIAGGGAIFQSLANLPLPSWIFPIAYAAIFAPIVYLGAHSVDRLNLCLISGVILTYLGFVAVSIGHIDTTLLGYANWGKAVIALPVLFTAFTYQVIIPTLMTYMNRNVRKIRTAVICGSAIPLVIYLIWETVILGIVPPDGPGGLIEAAQKGMSAVGPLHHFVSNPYIPAIGNCFAFFALTTSFIPLALSFFDFLADGFRWSKTGPHRAILCAVVFGAPLLVAIAYPTIFLKALEYAGGVSCALLFGLMPPLMAWVGRYLKKYPEHTRQLPGGKPLLAFLIGFSALIILLEMAQHF